ncbi:MAG: hypothetical protein ACYC8T_22430, partial [Myxococcaceae bacterium]
VGPSPDSAAAMGVPAKLLREVERMKSLTPEQAMREAEQIQRQYGVQAPAGAPAAGAPAGSLGEHPAPAPADSTPTTEAGWVREEAHSFFTHMLAGDARALVDHSAVPFQLEDRRVGTPEELMQEWLKALRSKRTDLLTLFGVEVLTPAEMEKKYGKPPARLAALPWKAPRTYVAVANISGRAAIAIFRDMGAGAWKAVGYED